MLSKGPWADIADKGQHGVADEYPTDFDTYTQFRMIPRHTKKENVTAMTYG